jgi:hypothetical protein
MRWSVGFGWGENAGLICFWNSDERKYSTLAVHLLVRPSFWQLGRREGWYDGPIYSFGLGPFLLVTWMEKEDGP